MEIGLHLPSAQPEATASGILDVVRAAERLGFDTVWMFDHLFTPSDLDSAYPYSRDGSYSMSDADPFFDPLGLYGYLAGATERIKIGTNVMIPAYRHPIVLGKALATIENMAPERIILGAGTGWMREEFAATGVSFERRGARLTEYLQALRAVWSDEPSGFDGEFYSWPKGGFAPAPTKPIPIIVGGHSDAALRRAARHGDGWAVIVQPSQGRGLAGVAERLEVLDGYREQAGRADERFDLLYQHVTWFLDQPNEKLPLTGPPDVIAGSIRQLEQMGVTMLDLIVYGPPQLIIETAERFVEEVRPLL